MKNIFVIVFPLYTIQNYKNPFKQERHISSYIYYQKMK